MKLPPILTGIVLDPVAGTLDFTALGANFDPRTVLGVLHEPTNRFIFAKGRAGLGYKSIAGTVMTLALDTTGLLAGPLKLLKRLLPPGSAVAGACVGVAAGFALARARAKA